VPEDYSSSDLAQMVAGASNPAAPKGLQQAQSAAADRMANGEQSAYANSRLAQWTADETMGPASQAQSWFSGANLEGPMNGWATPFVEAYQSQYDEAAQAGELGSFFDRDGATGVVLYDHRSTSDEKKKYSFGDIYEGGEKKGNVYDLYDRDTANMMMGAFMLSGDEFGRAVKSAKPGELKEGELRAPDLDALITEKRA
jgi:Ni/Co efflux regulator RcnB